MQHWLKLGYHTGARENESYWRDLPWVSDGPGRRSERWNQRATPQVGEVHPAFGPRYEVGDRLVMYLTGPKKCPAILEVTRDPHWDPDRVDREGAATAEGDRWGVVTEVAAVSALSLDHAPALELLDVMPRTLGQKGHVKLERWQFQEAERLIGGGARDRDEVASRSDLVPVEGGNAEGYPVRRQAEIVRAERRESRLVRDYVATLEAQGDVISRNRLTTQEGAVLLTDVFNESRDQLIEAKAGTSRSDIRMAIGQLADYERLVEGNPRTAVLVDTKPRPDLADLLAGLGIALIWREGERFVDSDDGLFT